MLGHCSTAERKGSDDAFDGTEEFESAACDQLQHSLFTAVVEKLMFATKCLSYKLAPPTLADLTRAKKVLRHLKGTRELNLYLTIPALKTERLEQDLETHHGIFGCRLGR